MKTQLKPVKYIFFLLIFAFCLRFIFLFQHDLWFDEAFTYQISRLSVKDLITATAYDNNPPLYYLLIHILLNFTDNEIVLRLISLVFGLLTIPLIYLLGKKVAPKKIGLAASLIFTMSPLAVYQSTEVRMYSLAVFLTALCFLFFLRLKKTSGFLNYFFFCLFFLLGFYTSVYIALLLLPFNLLVLLRINNLNLKSWLICQILLIIFIIPWFYTFFLPQRGLCGVCPSSFSALAQTLVSPAIGGLGQISLSEYPHLPFPELMLFSFTSFMFILFFFKGLAKTKYFAFIIVSIITVLFILGLWAPVFSPRAFSIFLPMIIIISTLGIYSFSQKYQKPLLLTFCLLLLSVNIIQLQTPLFWGEPLKQSSSILYKLTNTGDVIAHTSLATYYSYKYYLPDNRHILLTDNPLSSKTIAKIGGQPQKAETINYQKLYLINISKWNKPDEINLINKTLLGNYPNHYIIKVGPINIERFEK